MREETNRAMTYIGGERERAVREWMRGQITMKEYLPEPEYRKIGFKGT